jgi:hypothetical protein
MNGIDAPVVAGARDLSVIAAHGIEAMMRQTMDALADNVDVFRLADRDTTSCRRIICGGHGIVIASFIIGITARR